MRFFVALLVFVLAACSSRPSTDEASRLGLLLMPRFEALESWAHRALDAETVPSSVEEFEARLFAPTEGERDVVEAWMARTGTAPFAASAHGTPSPIAEDRMARVRVPDHGSVRIGVMTLDDPRTAAADAIDVVVVERTVRRSATEEVSFAVAFTRP